MRLTVGMLRGIIEEEVTKVRRAQLREMGGEVLGPRSLAVNAGGGSPSMSRSMTLQGAIRKFASEYLGSSSGDDDADQSYAMDYANNFFNEYDWETMEGNEVFDSEAEVREAVAEAVYQAMIS